MFNLFKTLILSCLCCLSLYANPDIGGGEVGGVPNTCVLCTEQRPNPCETCGGGDVSYTDYSPYKDPVYPYPGAPKLKCVPCDCGNGTKDNGEGCDDGNNVAFDGCNAICVQEFCGDGIAQTKNLQGVHEECDFGEGNANTANNCRTNCQLPKCNDHILDDNEQCDGTIFGNKPANISDTQWAAKKCNPTTCQVEYNPCCGDGIKGPGEACDGTQFGTKPANVTDAKWAAKVCGETCNIEYGPYCGDGKRVENCALWVCPPGDAHCKACVPEACDGTEFGEKPANISDAQWATKTCSASCDVAFGPFCGDKIKNGTEGCDGTQFGTKPANVSDAQWAAKVCGETCNIEYRPYCGDGRMDTCPIIQCPPGMVCPAVCQPEKCDGTQFGTKPANVTDAQWATKTCSASCDVAFGPYCGDGIKNGSESCDGTQFGTKPANVTDAQWAAKTCSTQCNIEYQPCCGDGRLGENEQCDGSLYHSKPGNVSDAVWASRTCNNCQINYPTCAGIELPQPQHRTAGIYDNICLAGKFNAEERVNTEGFSNLYLYKAVYEQQDGLQSNLVDGQDYTEMFLKKVEDTFNVTRWGDDGTWNSFKGIWGGNTSYDATTDAEIYYKNSVTVDGVVCYTCAAVRITGCFDPETSISTDKGTTKIKDLSAGDYVINPVSGKTVQVKSIIESYEENPMIELHYGTNILKVTDGHPVKTSKGIVKAKELKAGDTVYGAKGEEIKLGEVKILPKDASQRVLNLTLNSGSDDEDHIVLSEGIQTGDYVLQGKIAK